jgi:hypothetical protein
MQITTGKKLLDSLPAQGSPIFGLKPGALRTRHCALGAGWFASITLDLLAPVERERQREVLELADGDGTRREYERCTCNSHMPATLASAAAVRVWLRRLRASVRLLNVSSLIVELRRRIPRLWPLCGVGSRMRQVCWIGPKLLIMHVRRSWERQLKPPSSKGVSCKDNEWVCSEYQSVSFALGPIGRKLQASSLQPSKRF